MLHWYEAVILSCDTTQPISKMSVKMEDWPKEKQVLLRSIKEKEERLKDFEKVRGKKNSK